MSSATPARRERAQATVELALVLPVVVVVLALVVQSVLLGRDRLVAVHAVRAAARAVIVEPDERAARAAIAHLPGAETMTVQLHGDRRAGAEVTVTVGVRARIVAPFGRAVGPVVLHERLTVRVEGGP